MPTIRKLLKDASQRFDAVEIGTARLDARILMEFVLDVDHAYIITNNKQLIKKTDAAKYEELVARREKREPIANIIGHREFWSMDFKTTPNTLDPRADSETLIEAVMKLCDERAKSYKILDFGTGTGCLILSLLSEYINAKGVAVDISDHALEVAKHNAKELALSERIEFVKSNWGEGVNGEFDIIISNPPYIPSAEINQLEPEVTEYDPHLALDGGSDGLDDYRRLAPDVARLLTKNGLAIFEIGQGQEQDVCDICNDAGLEFIKFEKDLAGIVRCVIVTK